MNVNPITRLDYPDPDVIRVGDTYYMVSTTMHFMPGCEILQSFDLMHWEHEELIKKSLELAGYNMLVTSEISMGAREVYTAYHNLWRIEESFRIMKSQLDARPVYLQKENTIVGHFLICYLAVLLTRLLQFKILKNNYCSEDLFEFIRDFRVAKISDRKYINLSRGTEFIKDFSTLCNLPLTSYFLSDGEIKKMLSHRF